MLWLILLPFRAFLALRRSQNDLALENLVLRHQLQVLIRTNPRPRLRQVDRIFWVWLRHLWPAGWRDHLLLVRPGDRDRLAPAGLAALLDVAVAQPPRPPCLRPEVRRHAGGAP
jgi:hypothetical protein